MAFDPNGPQVSPALDCRREPSAATAVHGRPSSRSCTHPALCRSASLGVLPPARPPVQSSPLSHGRAASARLRPSLRKHLLHPLPKAAIAPDAPSPATAPRARELVDQILREANLYRVLGLAPPSAHHPRQAVKLEDIRRGYIARSRTCHPDKLPHYAPCTAAFQKLSLAYETLSRPASRRMYDYHQAASHRSVSSPCPRPSHRPSTHPRAHPSCPAHAPSASQQPERSPERSPGPSPPLSTNPDETLNGVLYTTFCEFMDGDFHMIRVLINAFNEGNLGLSLGEDAIQVVEQCFKRLRRILLRGDQYMKSIRFDLMHLYELGCSLRRCGYFNLIARVRISLAIVRVTLMIPMRIDEVCRRSREDDGEQEKEVKEHPRRGLIPSQITGLLEATVAVLEKGERATLWISSASSPPPVS